MAFSNTLAAGAILSQQATGSDRLAALDPQEAWRPYEPSADRPWTLALAAHLYRRAGYGASWPQLQKAHEIGPQQSVSQLLAADGGPEDERFDQFEADAARGGSLDTFRAWWLRRLLETSSVLREKMTFFWHNHFATSAARAGNAQLFHRYLALLRGEALGRFDRLLAAVCREPAVLLASGAKANRRAQPNTSLARNLLEHFSLGPNQFSESDVREMARALTGWFVLRDQLRFIPYEHDEGEKQLLGRQGNFGIEEAVRIVLQQQATPRHIVRKLFAWFVSDVDQPSDELIEPLVARFSRDFDTAAVVEIILRSNLFFSAAAYRRKVKSPLEFAVGIIRGFEVQVPTIQLGNDLAAAGQDLCRPPTSNGWPSGSSWLAPAAMLVRQRLAAALLAESGPYDKRLDPQQLSFKHGFREAGQAKSFLLNLFLQDDLADTARSVLLNGQAAGRPDSDPGRQLRGFALAVLASPEFQLA